MGEIIYEKHFHKETIEELKKERTDLVEAFGEDAKQAPSFNEIMKKIYSNVTYLALPEREKMAQTFIETAIEISNEYELDIEIEEHLSHISATYYFDCGACMGFLRRIIEMSDDISFFDHIKGFDMVMSLDFYTKAGNVKKCAVGKHPKSEKPVRQSGGLLRLHPLPVLRRRQPKRVACIDPDAIVIDKNITENDRFDLFSRQLVRRNLIDLLFLERGEKALHPCVVEAMSGSTEALYHAAARQLCAKSCAGVLASAI